MVSITERQVQLEQLFVEWKNRLPKEVNFVEDGLVDEDAWELVSPRVMVLLKEANSNESWKYQDFIRNGQYLLESTTWPTLIRWVYGLLHGYPAYTEVEENWTRVREQSVDFFKGVYFANVKKIPGGPKANDYRVLEFATKHADLLVRQIEIVGPTLVLCCGNVVYDSVRSSLQQQHEKFVDGSTDGGLRFSSWNRMSCRVVKYHHPLAHYPRGMSYTFLMSEFRKLI
ncbi:hypothetical protein [Alicyclobacillus sp. ALC3]|uniref:hypothetical protein n=1 Tax=Alicyclobacillus sp. ALC3 TaxID=2796143 RepID=UPI002378648F|nr:hypothetical protein [Alicyclobacillus sp. ALC3]WDL99179.1 hypothetical protein JC200_11360 [Alicyclobacillus sp. ALC3]